MSSEWRKFSIEEIGEVIGGGTPSSKVEEYWNGDISWITPKDLSGYAFRRISKGNRSITNLGLEKSSARILPKDTILITSRAPIGYVAIADKKVSTNQGFKSIILNKGFDPDFVYYLIKTNINVLESVSSGSTFKEISGNSLKKLKFNFPEFQEQKAIANILGKLDDKIELNRQMNQTLENMAQALFKSWFVDFDPVLDNALAAGNPIPEALQAKAEKRLNRHSELDAESPQMPKELKQQFPNSFVFNDTLNKWIPEGWEVKSFGELIDQTIGGDWGKDKPDEKHTEEVKIIRGTDIPSIKNCKINSAPTRFVETKKLKTRKLEIGDIVIEVSGGSPTQPTGRSILLTENIITRLGGIVEPASFCRRLKPKNEEFGVLCSEQLSYIYSIGKMWEYQNQSTGIANFQTKYFLEAEMIVLPNEREVLSFFTKTVSKWKDKASSNENVVLVNLRDTLLPQLISGKLKVPEAMLQVEKVLE